MEKPLIKHLEECELKDACPLERKVDDLNNKIDRIEKSVHGLVEAWNTASNVVKFTKWISGLGAAVYFLYEMLKSKF